MIKCDHADIKITRSHFKLREMFICGDTGAVIVRPRKELKRENGMRIRYDDNAAVVIDQEGNPKGTRVFGAIPLKMWINQIKFSIDASDDRIHEKLGGILEMF